MIRRITLQYTEETPIETILSHKNQYDMAICNYANLTAPIKRIPKIVEYNWDYRYFFFMMNKRCIPASPNYFQKIFCTQHPMP